METRISATEASREPGDEPVCRIVPARSKFTLRDLVELLRRLPRPDPGFWDDVEWAIERQGKAPESSWRR